MDFNQKVYSFLDNRKNANNVVDLINQLEETSPDTTACVQALNKLFAQVFRRGYLTIDSSLKLTNPKAYDIEDRYVKWLTEMYESCFNKLVQLLGSSQLDVRTQALRTMFDFLSVESLNSPTERNSFPGDKLQKILSKVLVSPGPQNELLVLYSSYLSYRDVLYYTWKVMKDILVESQEYSDVFTFSLLELIEKMNIPNDGDDYQLLCYEDPGAFKYKDELVRKWIQKVWLTVTNRHLSPANHRKLLLVLIEGYLSKIRKPTLLTDFLTGSLAMGGATGLLALQGMSVLVTKHNLECPNIFGKLYNMFQPEIFYTRYKARLFYLADVFLQSTHVSEKLVAAFAKRLSRLSLVAQAADLVLLMQFVGNLLIRHPALLVMVHSPVVESMESDPFDMEEPDPLKSRALDSSLWELALLKNHVQPKIAAAAKFLDANMPPVEWDFREHLDSSYAKMFDSEMKKNAKVEPALTFVRPVSISQLRDDRLYKLWSLT